MTTTCTYDRVGTGTSDPPSEPGESFYDVPADLHQLAGAATATPYLLVGSSGGGNVAVPYAGRYPRQVPASSCSTCRGRIEV